MIKLERLVIKKLFGVFDYEIDLKPDDLTVLISPNGYGKTTILRILYEFTQKNIPVFFVGLCFQKIEIVFTGNQSVVFEKQKENDTKLNVTINGQSHFLDIDKTSHDIICRELSFMRRIEGQNDGWIDQRTVRPVGAKEIFEVLGGDHKAINLVRQIDKIIAISNDIDKLQIPNIYFIREQRLLKRIEDDKATEADFQRSGIARPRLIYEEIIDEYATFLKEVMDKADLEYAEKSRKLDSSYPRRLFESKTEIQENDFRTRFDKISETQKSLQKYGLSITQEENPPEFDPANAKALSVYLGDVEEKLSVFDPLLRKLNLFSTIINSRMFSHKKMIISKEYGLKFVADTGDLLELSDLSSGEQHEVVLLFDLLFRVESNTLVLIDEPEISLHIAWQKAFLADMLKIIELRKISVMVATHSPQIVRGNWKNVVDLGEENT
jgi:ABC-type lipoprotein export system ATPase subunit